MTRVFDPLDAECKYTQNPTKQSKTVDKGLRPLCEDVSNNSNLRQEHRRCLTIFWRRGNIIVNMKKRILKLILVTVLAVLFTVPMVGCKEKIDDYPPQFRLNECGESYTILSWEANEQGVVLIPFFNNGKPVTVIGENFFITFSGQATRIERIEIPTTIERIEDYAFHSNQFSNVPALATDVVFIEASNLEHIGNKVFYGQSVNILTLPENLRTIGDYSFSHIFMASARVDGWLPFPRSLESIGRQTFMSIGGVIDSRFPLNRLILGENLRHIGEGSFTRNMWRREMMIDDRNEHFFMYGGVNGSLMGRDGTLIAGTPSNIPLGTRRIGDFAFNNNPYPYSFLIHLRPI
ncbi:MAG: leucine-rich repeat domain-containing protein [Firmicutes bacterium]|nr:leucine-rich repeat domain-containing protein [Bacillota bacterium]